MLEGIKSLLRKVRFRWRSSITGRYVPKAYADAHKAETVRERVR